MHGWFDCGRSRLKWYGQKFGSMVKSSSGSAGVTGEAGRGGSGLWMDQRVAGMGGAVVMGDGQPGGGPMAAGACEEVERGGRAGAACTRDGPV